MIASSQKAYGKKFVVFGGSVERINALERMFFFAGALVEAATSCQKGIAFMRNSRPDIAIIDDSSLDMKLEEIAADIHKDPLIADTPLIFITQESTQPLYNILFAQNRHVFVSQTNFDVMQVVLMVEQLLLEDKDDDTVFDFSEQKRVPVVTPESQLRLLVVEDDPLLRNLLSIRLQKSAIAHEFCHSGTEAMSHIEAYNPTVLVLDLMLPGKSGMEILSELRAKPHLENLPVIIFSNKDDDEERMRAKALGVEDFLVKAMTDLSTVVEKIIKLGATR